MIRVPGGLGAFRSSISGAEKGTTKFLEAYCYSGDYNAKENACNHQCATDCFHVLLIMTPVLECHGGFVRNSDYICIPAIIGLEAGSLAILFISLIFYIVGCIQVNKARK